MSARSQLRSEEFLKLSGQFQLGALVTEASHPVTASLGDVAKQEIAAALKLLFDVDDDVLRVFRAFVRSGRAGEIKEIVLRSLKNGGRIFLTGCGSTGRLSILLDSVWRDFWRRRNNPDLENRTFSVMAGGDYALIKSVEGFEDFAEFGKKQLNDLGVATNDVVFAITEGGETSFVIGTAWAGVAAGAKVYFVYNNPDEILCNRVERSREVIQEPNIEKLNLTTGPMAITGSTRMQATSIQLCVLLTILEMTVCDLLGQDSATLPETVLAGLTGMHANLQSPAVRRQLAQLVALEESVYRSGNKNNYYADRLGIDVLTDTTERSPTYCTPPFRKFDDARAAESWSFLFLPCVKTPAAWRHILRREPRCVEWSKAEVRGMVTADKCARTLETIRKISRRELMRFKIGLDGRGNRPLNAGDSAIAIVGRNEAGIFQESQLKLAAKAGAKTGWLCFGNEESGRRELAIENVFIPIPENCFHLDMLTRVAAKLVMNALSTCTMVRLGRVLGNYMIWVVPSNLKLIDRATRYITKLTGLDYAPANALLFEIIEYVEPRMKADQAYPPVVSMAVMRVKWNCGNEEAEVRLKEVG